MSILLLSMPCIFGVLLIVGVVSDNWALAGVGGLGTACVVLLYWSLVWPLEYTLTEDALVIRYGRQRARVPYDDITSVAPFRGLMKGPNLSVDRLRVTRRSALSVEISPHDKPGFLTALVDRASDFERQGDRVVRAGEATPDS